MMTWRRDRLLDSVSFRITLCSLSSSDMWQYRTMEWRRIAVGSQVIQNQICGLGAPASALSNSNETHSEHMNPVSHAGWYGATL